MTDIVERLSHPDFFVRTGTRYDLNEAIAEIELLRAALTRSMTAIDDWLNLYASDLCLPERVEEADKRVGEYGTLSYIAQVQEQNRLALTSGIRKSEA